jgi:hypothetical protein
MGTLILLPLLVVQVVPVAELVVTADGQILEDLEPLDRGIVVEIVTQVHRILVVVVAELVVQVLMVLRLALVVTDIIPV